jgi:AhpD family alkylhydroperoxidase
MASSEPHPGQVIALPRARAANGPARPGLAPIARGRSPWYVRLILRAQRRKYGRALAPALAWARLPRAFLALTLLYRALDRSGARLDPGLRALVQVRVSQLNGCAFCVDINSAAAMERRVDPAKLAALAEFAGAPAFDARERAALAYAEAMTESGRGVDDALFAALRREFDADEVVELTALVAFQNLTSKFNAALGIPAQGFCAAPRAKEDT